MSDWEAFQECVTWFPAPVAKVQLGEPVASAARVLSLSDEFATLFPTLHELLVRARLTPVAVEERRRSRTSRAEYHLLGWDGGDGHRMGWLCPMAVEGPSVFREHATLFSAFGGIGERFNEPEDTWLLNLHAALTIDIAKSPEWIPKWIAESEPSGAGSYHLPLDVSDFYTVALEANGNETLCHRGTGEVILFAHDHSFDHVVPLENCPEYTFYRIPSAPRFRDWVERVATQWMSHIRH